MITRTTATLSLLLLAILVSCEQKNTAYGNKIMTVNDSIERNKVIVTLATGMLHNTAAASWLSPKNMTPFSFLEVVKKESDNAMEAVTMADDFPNNWIRKEDIAGLMELIYSQEKCNCFKNPISSKIPQGNATVGGYAIAFVNAYKEKRKVSFGLYACPETDKQKVDVLRKWWAAQAK